MPTLSIPLKDEKLFATGDVVLRAFVDLLLKDDRGGWHRETFRVDSATDMTTFPAYRAQQLGLPIPANPSALTHNQTGLEVRSGYLRCQVEGLSQTEHVFPVFFLGDPSRPPNPNAPEATLPRNLLGLSGVVDKVKWHFDGDPVPPHAAYGMVTFEEK